jgi:transcriptional regulator with PAS, ATPase and Fis domain
METKINIELIDKKLKRYGRNRTEFAKELGIHKALLSYYIHNPTLKSIEIIVDGLGLKPKDLIL